MRASSSLPIELGALVDSVEPPSGAAAPEIRARLDALAKPPGSLGRLEEAAVRLARILGDPPPPLGARQVLVFAADHGVVRGGVSAYPSSVTAAMCRTFVAGRAAINALAESVGATVTVVDVGVDASAEELGGVRPRKVRRGTRDLRSTPALTRSEAASAIRAGAESVGELSTGPFILALGEMGIGNSTAAAALTGLLLGREAEEVVGRGAGVDDTGLRRKTAAVREAMARVRRELGPSPDPFDALAHAGGLEIAAIAGATLQGAALHRPVVTDGFIATAGALVAARLAPAVTDHLFAGHRSVEPGHALQLQALGLTPLLDLEMRLGEGTGATLALPLLEAAASFLREMATLDEVVP